ncbi:MAG: CehA/McbA family metallohydrolase [Cellulosilyticaceae bacterium]
MYKRLELHNHTTESDSNLTCEELIDFMASDQVDAFALTDHNTISGHAKVARLLAEKLQPMSCIYGMEYTTYYGHILCLNLKEYVPWENINAHHPELLFMAAKEKGALAGIAHPFSEGYPIGTCGFAMTVTDYSCVDFIEVFNNPESLHDVNQRGLLWWEELILAGHSIAFTSGMDLHNTSCMHQQFATFIEGTPDGNIEEELTRAIKTQRTWVSKGPLLQVIPDQDKQALTFSIVSTHKPGYTKEPDALYHLSLRTQKGTLSMTFDHKVPLVIPYCELELDSPIIAKLYCGSLEIEDLVCLAPVIHLS